MDKHNKGQGNNRHSEDSCDVNHGKNPGHCDVHGKNANQSKDQRKNPAQGKPAQQCREPGQPANCKPSNPKR